MKRSYEEIAGDVHTSVTHAKCRRLDVPDRLSSLSDELILVLLSYLPVRDLIRCERCVSITAVDPYD